VSDDDFVAEFGRNPFGYLFGTSGRSHLESGSQFSPYIIAVGAAYSCDAAAHGA